MAFDAAMLSVILAELRSFALGGKIEKIYQPEQDEIQLAIRAGGETRRLLINAGANNPRLCLTATQKENPLNAPMFCMLLRKHLGGARLAEIEQPAFERVAVLTFDTRDELGFATQRCIIAEIMGKYSNLIFTDADRRILAVLRPVDFTTSRKRQVLPGMRYEMPPPQDKGNPLTVTQAEFCAAFAAADETRPADKWITSTYLGLSSALAREITYRATRYPDTPLRYCEADRLWSAFAEVMAIVRGERPAAPTMASDGGRPVEYSFLPLTQYGEAALTAFPDTGSLLDAFFGARDRATRVKQRAADILHLLTNAQARITRKLALQREELADCAKGAQYKADGDLITANLWQLSRGMKQTQLTDYGGEPDADGNYPTRTLTLDERLSPAQNAQRLYKRYNKAKTAEIELARQITQGEAELVYLESVEDALGRAETDQDLAEIRDELHQAGYASRMKAAAPRKQKAPSVAQYRTDDGLRVLCGKNNLQNEYITHKLAGKDDYWFHAKGLPGSHVVLFRGEDAPTDRDFTQAAEIAAYHSGAADGQNVAVDYTLARHVKKPAGGKPGLVIYHTNWTAYVTPDPETIKRLRIKG
ncbi:MAG: NFACT family protein [Clostridia bacterium]|nr:NFACT family protein [Clostridia bacterium]